MIKPTFLSKQKHDLRNIKTSCCDKKLSTIISTLNFTRIFAFSTSPDLKKTFHLDRWNLRRFTRTRKYMKKLSLEYFTFYQVCGLQGKPAEILDSVSWVQLTLRGVGTLTGQVIEYSCLFRSDQTDIDILFMLVNILLCAELFMRNATNSGLYTNIWSGRIYFRGK